VSGRFVKFPVWLLRETNLSARALQVYAGLLVFDGPGGIFPSKARLAGRLGVSESTVSRGIRELVAAGVVEVDLRQTRRGRDLSNSYLLSRVSPDVQARMAAGEGLPKDFIGEGGWVKLPVWLFSAGGVSARAVVLFIAVMARLRATGGDSVKILHKTLLAEVGCASSIIPVIVQELVVSGVLQVRAVPGHVRVFSLGVKLAAPASEPVGNIDATVGVSSAGDILVLPVIAEQLTGFFRTITSEFVRVLHHLPAADTGAGELVPVNLEAVGRSIVARLGSGLTGADAAVGGVGGSELISGVSDKTSTSPQMSAQATAPDLPAKQEQKRAVEHETLPKPKGKDRGVGKYRELAARVAPSSDVSPVVVGGVQGFGIKNFSYRSWGEIDKIIRGCLPEEAAVTIFMVLTLFFSVLKNANGEVLRPLAYLRAVAKYTPENIVKDWIKLKDSVLLHENNFAIAFGDGVARWRRVAENMQSIVLRAKINHPLVNVVRAINKKDGILADTKYRVCTRHKYQIPTCEDCYTARRLTFKEIPWCGECEQTTRMDSHCSSDNPHGFCKKCHPNGMSYAEKYAIIGFKQYPVSYSKERQNVNR